MIYVGVDVDSKKLKSSLTPPQKNARKKNVANTEDGIKQLLDFALRAANAPVTELAFVMEATGVYHELAAQMLHELGATVYVVNPARVAQFKKSEGVQTKTDEVDAAVLSQFGQYNEVRSEKLIPYQPEPPEVRHLKQLVARLDVLEKDYRREQNRLHAAEVAKAPEAVLSSIADMMESLERQKKALEDQIDQHIDQNPSLKQNATLLTSIPGIANKTARRLLAFFASRNFADAKAAAAFAGLAVAHRQSGSHNGRSTLTKSGDPRVRTALYMPAVVATRCNPVIHALAERLEARGKPKMKIIGAAMRKLLHIAFGVLKSQREFDPEYALHHAG